MGVFFFGMGYSATATARAIHLNWADDISVAGTTRSEDKAEELADSAYHAHIFDGTRPSETAKGDLARATHVFLSIPPDEHGDPALRQHRADLDASTTLEWLCYWSTVGV